MIDLSRVPVLKEHFYCLNEALETATKKYKELSVSVETLKYHGIDVSSIALIIDQEKQNADKLSKCLCKIEKEISEKQTEILKLLDELYKTYMDLSKLKMSQMDPLAIKTASLLYSNMIDNLQFRPIAEVCTPDNILELCHAQSNI